MTINKEDFFKKWKVVSYGGANPESMTRRVSLGGRIELIELKSGEIRCITSNSYSKQPDDKWHELKLSVGQIDGTVVVTGNIGLPTKNDFRFEISNKEKTEIRCVLTNAPDGTWNGEED